MKWEMRAGGFRKDLEGDFDQDPGIEGQGTDALDLEPGTMHDEAMDLMIHPLLTRGVTLPTKPIEKLYTVIRLAVLIRCSGLYIAAPTGFGKTRATRCICQNLSAEFDGLAVVRQSIDNHPHPSIRGFYARTLQSVGHHKLNGETYQMRIRSENSLIEIGRRSRFKMVVLFVDEAHQMQAAEYLYLKDLENKLEDSGVILVTFLFGKSPEFEKRRILILNNGGDDLLARFAMRELKLDGYSSLDDIEELLKTFDHAAGSDGEEISWTRDFFPESYQSGFRMERQAQAFLGALRSCGALAAVGGCSCRQIFIALRHFMANVSEYDCANMKIPPRAWEEAASFSLIKEISMVVNGDTKSDVKV